MTAARPLTPLPALECKMGSEQMSMPQAVRHINETRVLGTLFRTGSMSRADLARALSLTRSTAGNLVSGLVQDGLVVEEQEQLVDHGSRTGRPGHHVRLNAHHAFFLGADIGIGRLTVVALDLTGSVVGRVSRQFDLDRADPETVLDRLAALTRSVVAKLPAPGAVQGLGVAVPGLLDHAGNVLRAPILGWRNVPMLEILHSKLPRLATIAAENDANAFAVAELYRAGSSAPADALYMVIDAGVGGGVVSNGALLRGEDGYAGEIGHVFVGDNGFFEMATLPGSLESFIGREAVMARFRFYGGTGRSLEDLVEALDSDAAAMAVADWSYYLGRGIATLTSVLNPGKIVLGGPVAVLHKHAEKAVLASVKKHLLSDHPIPRIELSQLGVDGPAIGAASMMHQSMLALDKNLIFNGGQS